MDFIATGFSLKAADLASTDRRGLNERKAAPPIYLIPKGYLRLDMTMAERGRQQIPDSFESSRLFSCPGEIFV
jgi:hypothetical protein